VRFPVSPESARLLIRTACVMRAMHTKMRTNFAQMDGTADANGRIAVHGFPRCARIRRVPR
jgi:hypothetical protein